MLRRVRWWKTIILRVRNILLHALYDYPPDNFVTPWRHEIIRPDVHVTMGVTSQGGYSVARHRHSTDLSTAWHRCLGRIRHKALQVKAKFHYAVQLASRFAFHYTIQLATSSRAGLLPARELVRELLAAGRRPACARRVRVAGQIPLHCPAR